MRTARKLALSVAVFAGAAAALEVGLRVAGHERPEPPPIVLWNQIDDEAILAEGAPFRADADCLWTPRPGAALLPPLGPPAGAGAPEVVNAAGFRGPELAREPVPGRLRIAVLGDSSTFGYGVAFEDTYGARLVELLAERGVEAEVLNGGVVGYSVQQGLERYRHDVRPYRPHVVVAAFGAVNDAIAAPLNDLDKFALERRRGGLVTWLEEHSRAVQWASGLGRGAPSARRSARGPTDPPVSERMPEGMVPRVSLEAFEAALRELAALVHEDGARFVAISMPRRLHAERVRPFLREYSERVVALAAREGWPLVDALALFRAQPDPRALLLDVVHPSPDGHALIAGALADALTDSHPEGLPGPRGEADDDVRAHADPVPAAPRGEKVEEP